MTGSRGTAISSSASEIHSEMPSGSPGPSRSRAPHSPTDPWALKGTGVRLDRPVVMGVLNLTPDSFSDGGELLDVEAAVARAEAMIAEGADILDVGGESTRPGAPEVEEEEELRRVIPAIRALSGRVSVPISVDTRKARVAREAIGAGARIVNDVSGLAYDREMADVLAETGAGVVLMHMRGTPADMREHARYRDVAEEVASELRSAVDRALSSGVEADRIVLDPGIGFAKTADQSIRVLARLDRIAELGFPVLVGPSRKSFLGEILGGASPKERVAGTAAACVMAYLRGARIFRVHDVSAVAQALAVAHAIEEGRTGAGP